MARLAPSFALTSGCPDVKIDPDETSAGPIVEFDPSEQASSRSPTTSCINPTTGKVNLPPRLQREPRRRRRRARACSTSSTASARSRRRCHVTFTKPVDPASIDRACLQACCWSRRAADPATSTAIPSSCSRARASASRTRRSTTTARCVRLAEDRLDHDRPARAARPEVDVHRRAEDRHQDGRRARTTSPSFTWSLVRQPENPVTVDDRGQHRLRPHAARSDDAGGPRVAAGHRPAVEGARPGARVPRREGPRPQRRAPRVGVQDADGAPTRSTARSPARRPPRSTSPTS